MRITVTLYSLGLITCSMSVTQAQPASPARQLAGEKAEQLFQPALVSAFIVEKHSDGQFTMFVSSSPTPMAGAIYILQPERVHPVDLPLRKAMVCVTKWGAGAAEMRAAMRPQNLKEDQPMQ